MVEGGLPSSPRKRARLPVLRMLPLPPPPARRESPPPDEHITMMVMM